MIVTGIYKRKGKYEIYLDHEHAFSLTDEGLYKLKLTQGMEFVPSESVNAILSEDEILRCKNRAMYIVSVTPKSKKILQSKLREEGFSENAVEQTMQFMQEYDFTDDVELAKSLVRSGVRKNSSTRQIKQKLYEKGISREDSSRVLDEMEIDEKENALEVAMKKYRSLRNKTKEEIIKKVRYALSYRAFSYDAMRYALGEIEKIIKESELEE
ncbi:MAG: regulatory protein RecX [Peptostreptococcaceae bacterium]|nr:regulatory protein RecX [Peptostreptococcaceae bacterium]